jgi:hypothetical protein
MFRSPVSLAETRPIGDLIGDIRLRNERKIDPVGKGRRGAGMPEITLVALIALVALISTHRVAPLRYQMTCLAHLVGHARLPKLVNS